MVTIEIIIARSNPNLAENGRRLGLVKHHDPLGWWQRKLQLAQGN
jgi:hypothetical protein